MRSYMSHADDVSLIASEVIQNGQSLDWQASTSNEVSLASDVEKHLSKFNIGYVDAKKGTWGYKKNGTRHFIAIVLMKNAKGAFSSVLQKIRA